MDTALAEAGVATRVDALRARIASSRANSDALFETVRRPNSPSLPPGIEEIVGTIRGKVALSDSDDTNASPNPGLPMMAGTINKQK